MKLSDEDLEFYNDNGYVVVENLFDGKAVEEISRLTMSIADKAMSLSCRAYDEDKQMLDGSQVVLAINSDSGAKVIKRVSWAAGREARGLDYGRVAQLLTPVAQILEGEQADHIINQIHYKFPKDGVRFGFHQDEQNRRKFDPKWEDVNKKGSFVQTLAAIDECTLDNGPLYIMPKSHKFGYLEFGKFLDSEEELDQTLSAKGKAKTALVPLLMNPGDVCFMHPHLIHGSYANHSDVSRRLFINGLSSVGANHEQYPGVGSSKTISLLTGKEIGEPTSETGKPKAEQTLSCREHGK